MLLEGKQNKSKNCIILQFIYSSCDDPNTYDDAIKSEVWRKSMDLEIESIESNNTWELTSLHEGSKAIGVKWIYKTKYNEMGKIEKHKARSVPKRYTQKYDINYNEVFALCSLWRDQQRCMLLPLREL
jgi:hypothetical protein